MQPAGGRRPVQKHSSLGSSSLRARAHAHVDVDTTNCCTLKL